MKELNTKNNLLLNNKLKMLNKNEYIISLLKEGIKNREISNDDAIDIQIKIMDLLKEIIMKYTKGESTSVTVEVTQQLQKLW